MVQNSHSPEPSTADNHLLVRELTHRINNEFASMIGLVSLASIRSSNSEVKAALEKVSGLLYDHASVHRALEMPVHSATVDASAYLRALCQSIRRARLDARDIRLAFVAAPLRLRSDRCWRLGMIVSELIANSIKHAFASRGSSIRVELSSCGSLIRCCVSDNGSCKDQSFPGSGLKIVEALATDLDGEIVHRFGAGGATSILTFSADHGVHRAGHTTNALGLTPP